MSSHPIHGPAEFRREEAGQKSSALDGEKAGYLSHPPIYRRRESKSIAESEVVTVCEPFGLHGREESPNQKLRLSRLTMESELKNWSYHPIKKQ